VRGAAPASFSAGSLLEPPDTSRGSGDAHGVTPLPICVIDRVGAAAGYDPGSASVPGERALSHRSTWTDGPYT